MPAPLEVRQNNINLTTVPQRRSGVFMRISVRPKYVVFYDLVRENVTAVTAIN